MKKKTSAFQELHQGIEQLVFIYGYEKALRMVGSLCALDKTIGNPDRLELSVSFLKKKAMELFNVDSKDMLHGNKQHIRDARMCCYYLLIEHLDMSYSMVGIYFERNKRHVRHSYKKCEDILSIKSYYKDLYARFERLEQLFVNYIIQ